MNAPKYYPFDPNPRKPSEPPPPLSCDCQFHLLGPEDKYPPRPGAAYVMPVSESEPGKNTPTFSLPPVAEVSAEPQADKIGRAHV